MRGAKIAKLILLSCFVLPVAYSAQDTGGGSNSDMKSVCELAGGSFTGGTEGSWACCWDNWGCAGCQQGVCKVKCETQRCRKANGQARLQSRNTRIQGFKKFGIAPVVPKLSAKPKENSNGAHPAQ